MRRDASVTCAFNGNLTVVSSRMELNFDPRSSVLSCAGVRGEKNRQKKPRGAERGRDTLRWREAITVRSCAGWSIYGNPRLVIRKLNFLLFVCALLCLRLFKNTTPSTSLLSARSHASLSLGQLLQSLWCFTFKSSKNTRFCF